MLSYSKGNVAIIIRDVSGIGERRLMNGAGFRKKNNGDIKKIIFYTKYFAVFFKKYLVIQPFDLKEFKMARRTIGYWPPGFAKTIKKLLFQNFISDHIFKKGHLGLDKRTSLWDKNFFSGQKEFVFGTKKQKTSKKGDSI